jgi:hypothetical protein
MSGFVPSMAVGLRASPHMGQAAAAGFSGEAQAVQNVIVHPAIGRSRIGDAETAAIVPDR